MTLDDKVKAFLSVGDGSGYGYGIKRFNREQVYRIDGVNTLVRSVRGVAAHGAILNCDLTIMPCYIVKQDNVFAHGETLREAMEALRDKLFEDMTEDERIDMFLRETDREKAYPTQYFYGWHISDLHICDAPRELSEFERHYECNECDAKWATECNACHEEGKIKRAPQS